MTAVAVWGHRPDAPELLAARKDLADKSVRYTEQHPDVRAAQARARELGDEFGR